MIPEVTEIMTQSTAATPCKTDFLTRAARRGASICRMRDISRHKSMNISAELEHDPLNYFAGSWPKASLKDVTADLASTPLRNWHATWTIQLSNR